MLVIRPGQSPIAVGGTWWEAIVGGAVAGWNDDSPVHTRRTIACATVQQMTAPAVTETFENKYQTFSNQPTFLNMTKRLTTAYWLNFRILKDN